MAWGGMLRFPTETPLIRMLTYLDEPRDNGRSRAVENVVEGLRRMTVTPVSNGFSHSKKGWRGKTTAGLLTCSPQRRRQNQDFGHFSDFFEI